MASADLSYTPAPAVYRVPLLGAIARELAEGDADYPLYLILALVSIWGLAIFFFGLPALYLPAVVASPLMVVVLVAISRG
ncbi:hypothetical protein [Pararhodobacter zhoushanensis]|uniref:Fatty acid desaturase n=1 Tax=Pararhodobacter zhoushanensis TaxID=2479545 RepID=A0ABT3GX77_9RHOB|nr:hypothetical protein [Pararhodobacter zhoushanensis]MCW1404183.1 hypothetical protein [Novosphingobium sp. MW5]MCW1932153.1 hypothetical protein [Pararhodobacter zhoushanensis]